MEESDKKAFLEDFKKGDIQQKLDMWFFAIEQIGIWERIINEMSFIATNLSVPKKKIVKKE
jgi:hypothetical protein